MNRKSAQDLINRFGSLKILVLGDFMLDHFIWGRVERISPEAPVPVVTLERETLSLGGAGNVVNNIQTMGAEAIPLGVLGQDSYGDRVLKLFQDAGVPPGSLLRDSRPTTVKTRIIAHQQHVVRVDREERGLIGKDLQKQLARRFIELLDLVDGIIISDYSKGTISPNLLEAVLPAARKRSKLVCLDPKVRYFTAYTPVTILTPNQTEAATVLGYPIHSEEDLSEAGNRILAMLDTQALLITRGEKGMALFSEGKMTLVPARAREVFDVTGAGDTVISILCLALAAGANLADAVQLTNIAAGIAVGKVGTATVSPEELLAEFEH